MRTTVWLYENAPEEYTEWRKQQIFWICVIVYEVLVYRPYRSLNSTLHVQRCSTQFRLLWTCYSQFRETSNQTDSELIYNTDCQWMSFFCRICDTSWSPTAQKKQKQHNSLPQSVPGSLFICHLCIFGHAEHQTGSLLCIITSLQFCPASSKN